MYSITSCAAISYSDTNVLLISSMILFSYCSTKPSLIFLPFTKLRREFLRCFCKYLLSSEAILSYFSLSILLIVSLSLQDTFGIIGVPRYSPIKASICFLISGVKCKVVGVLVP
jgi:hypothetical protein